MSFKSFINSIQHIVAKSKLATDLAIKLRNQCNSIIAYHLADTPNHLKNGKSWLIENIAPNCNVFVDVGAYVGDWTECFLNYAPKGCLGLVFPDFVESGRFSSQQLGLSPITTASTKLRQGRIIDALFSLYDSKTRLPKALRKIEMNLGDFLVNTSPICLSYLDMMSADIDAMYLASKKEVHDWAIKKGFEVEYPCGIEGQFAEQAFIVIYKTNSL